MTDDKTYGDAGVRALARTFGAFYQELRAMSVPTEHAMELTKAYIYSISSGAKEINAEKAAREVRDAEERRDA